MRDDMRDPCYFYNFLLTQFLQNNFHESNTSWNRHNRISGCGNFTRNVS